MTWVAIAVSPAPATPTVVTRADALLAELVACVAAVLALVATLDSAAVVANPLCIAVIAVALGAFTRSI